MNRFANDVSRLLLFQTITSLMFPAPLTLQLSSSNSKMLQLAFWEGRGEMSFLSNFKKCLLQGEVYGMTGKQSASTLSSGAVLLRLPCSTPT